MRRFMLVAEFNLINGIEFDSGSVALDQCAPMGVGSTDCESYSNIETLINAYSSSPIIWFETLNITDEQRKKAEAIRRQWLANGCKYEPREVKL